MTPHETALVTILLERLKKTDSPDKDTQAEALIRQTTAEQPDAAYHLVQPGFELTRRTKSDRGT